MGLVCWWKALLCSLLNTNTSTLNGCFMLFKNHILIDLLFGKFGNKRFNVFLVRLKVFVNLLWQIGKIGENTIITFNLKKGEKPEKGQRRLAMLLSRMLRPLACDFQLPKMHILSSNWWWWWLWWWQLMMMVMVMMMILMKMMFLMKMMTVDDNNDGYGDRWWLWLLRWWIMMMTVPLWQVSLCLPSLPWSLCTGSAHCSTLTSLKS